MIKGIVFFEEYFDYMDDMTPEQFYQFMQLIKNLRFNGIDTEVSSVEDKVVRLAWRAVRPTVLKSARNAKSYEKKKEKVEEPEVSPEKWEEEVSTYTPTADITDDDLEKIFQAETKEGSRDFKWRIRQVADKTGQTQDWVQSQYNDYREKKFQYV